MAGDVTVRLPTLDRIIPPAQRKALLEQLAALQIGRIKRRTRQGVDVNGRPFRIYSAQYADNRRRAGWNTKPDLWLTGHMINSMQILQSSKDRALIGFTGSSARTKFVPRTKTRKHRKTGERLTLTVEETPHQVANALKAYWNHHGGRVPSRPFFGFSSADRLFLSKHALRTLTRMAGQVSLGRALRR